jgi:molybdopterin-guanine dinucleotide biosynthesis protein A
VNALSPEIITGVVLCGGQSRRFGSDKSEAKIDGLSLIERSISILDPLVSETFISSGSPRRYYPFDLRHVEDSFPDAGPLAGILSALDACPSAFMLVLAVDLPFITSSSLQKLVDQQDKLPDTVVVAGSSTRKQPQPLCGIWPRSLRHPLRAYLEAGRRSVFGFLEDQRVVAIEVPEKELRNVNRRRDLDGDI